MGDAPAGEAATGDPTTQGYTGELQGSVSSLASMLFDIAVGVMNYIHGAMDRIVPPERRSDLWARFNQFANERPKLTAFILAHVALSGIPLAFFILTTCTVTLFAIGTGLLVGLLGALFFIVFAVGFALVFLLPTLFFTTSTATFLFFWGLCGYYVYQWFSERVAGGKDEEHQENTWLDEYSRQTSSNSKPGRVKDEPRQNQNGVQSDSGSVHHDEKRDAQERTTQSQQYVASNKVEKQQSKVMFGDTKSPGQLLHPNTTTDTVSNRLPPTVLAS